MKMGLNDKIALAENELVKVLRKANRAIEDTEYFYKSGKVPDSYDVEHIPPFSERGQRAGYYNIQWSRYVDLRVYCWNMEGYGVDVREVDLEYTQSYSEWVILDLEKVRRTNAGFVGFNGLYAFCGELIAQYLDRQKAEEYEEENAQA